MTMKTPREAIEAAVTPGVTERRPIPGVRYHGFVVHPRQPGPVTLAIAHRAGEKIVVDLCREGLTIADAANLAKAYDIAELTGATDDGDGLTMAHATLGAIHLAKHDVIRTR
jgi:hypothetical protein